MMYECHVTFPISAFEELQYDSDISSWKLSKMDGDPTLGPGTRCYLTKYGDDPFKLSRDGAEIAAKFPEYETRVKVEYEIFDSRRPKTIVNVEGLIQANRAQLAKLVQQDLGMNLLTKQINTLQPNIRSLLMMVAEDMAKPVTDVKQRTALLEEIKKVLL